MISSATHQTAAAQETFCVKNLPPSRRPDAAETSARAPQASGNTDKKGGTRFATMLS
jgi:hypothetical protein